MPPPGNGPARLHLVAPGGMGERGWIEVTPLVDSSDPFVAFPMRDQEELTAADLPPGLAMVCAGGGRLSIRCDRVSIDADSSLTLDPRPGFAVRGSYRCGREPCQGAAVSVVPVGLPLRGPFRVPLLRKGDGVAREVGTGTDGRFELPELSPGDYRLETRLAEGRIHVGEIFTVRPPEQAPRESSRRPPVISLGELLIEEGLAIDFFVRDAGGQPIAGARVGGGQGRDPTRHRLFSAVTGEDGSAVVGGWSADLPLQVTCLADGFADHRQELDHVPIFVECVMEALGKIEGAIFDPDGEPVDGATIQTRFPDGSRYRAVTDGQGRFDLQALKTGTYGLDVAASGLAAHELEVEVHPGETLVLDSLELGWGDILSGRVVEADSGTLIPGARVAIVDPAGAGATRTDDDGRFELVTDPSRALRLRVAADGFPDQDFESPPDRGHGSEPFDLEMAHGGWIQILVFDDDTGEPCLECPISVNPAPRGRGHLTTDRNGQVTTEQLTAGRYVVSRDRVTSTGSMIFVEGGAEVAQAVRVEASKTSIVRFGGEGARVDVWLRPGLPEGWALVLRSPTRTTSVAQQPDGRFRLRRPHGTSVTLLLSASSNDTQVRQLIVPAASSARQLDLEIPDTSITGALPTAKPFEGGRVELLSLADAEVVARTRADRDGRFSLSFVPPGSYGLLVEGRLARNLELVPGQSLSLGLLEVGADPTFD